MHKTDFVFIAVDKIRSTPIFFTTIDDSYYIDSNPTNLVDKKGFKKSVNEDAVLEFSMSGYTIGNKTLFNNLHSLKAGELVIFSKNQSKYYHYYKYFGNIENKEYNKYIDELSEVTLKIFKKMLLQIGDRQIIVPLSAGNDSRLVASALKHLGASNVKCYSYGSSGSFEVKIARTIAKKLGYEWIFVPLTYKSERRFYKSKDYRDFIKFSETYSSVPFIQSLSTIKQLKDSGWANDNAVFINGNSGDFISGGHINFSEKNINEKDNKTLRKEIILNSLIDKHFSLWGYHKNIKNIDQIKASLWIELKKACEGNLKNLESDHLFYEYSEFIDRQSKYVISGQKIYEFYSYDWRIPLWDNDYLNFWQKVPAEFKKNQKLYKDMLNHTNFGGVWGDEIPVNKKNITPRWVRLFRFLFKVFFSFFGGRGKLFWKQFDKVVFNYWMITTHTLKAFSYLKILSDFKKQPRGIYPCWYSEEYIDKFKSNIVKVKK